jgi:WD40 repeat protein
LSRAAKILAVTGTGFNLPLLCVTDSSLSPWGGQSWPQPGFSRRGATKSSRRATKQKFCRAVLSLLFSCITALPLLAASIDAPANPVTALAFHPSGQLAAGGYGEVLIWDTVNSKLERRIAGLIGRVRGLAFSKDGAKLAIAEGDPGKSGAIRLLDYSTGHVLFTLDQEKDECYAVAFSPDSKLVAGGAPDGTVRVWNADDGKLVTTLKEQSGGSPASSSAPTAN